MTETATFAAGCFWGVQRAFERLEGVVETEAGYTGGHTRDPSYDQVCSGTTGHAEAVQVVYDPDEISFEALLEAFWGLHDPFRGPRVAQYRSAIFHHTEDQRRLAEAAMAELEASRESAGSLSTELSAAGDWWPAEAYHQHYHDKLER